MEFIRTEQPAVTPGLLQVAYAGRMFNLGIHHASLHNNPGIAGRRHVPPTGHEHCVYHLVLYVEGEGRCGVEKTLIRFHPGTLILTDPGCPHHFQSIDPAPFAYMEVTFGLEHPAGDLDIAMEELLSLYTGVGLSRPANPVQLDARAMEQLVNLMETVVRVFEAGGALVWYEAHRAMVNIFDFLVKRVFLPGAGSGGYELAPLESARQLIELRFNQALTIPELASVAALSPGYFQRAFRNAYGISAIAYQRSLRIRAAEDMLLNSEYRVSEIAERTGFSDVYYFSRVFKKVRGVSPRAFRQGERSR